MTLSPRLMIRLAIVAGTLLALAIVLLMPLASDASAHATGRFAQTAAALPAPAPMAQAAGRD